MKQWFISCGSPSLRPPRLATRACGVLRYPHWADALKLHLRQAVVGFSSHHFDPAMATFGLVVLKHRGFCRCSLGCALSFHQVSDLHDLMREKPAEAAGNMVATQRILPKRIPFSIRSLRNPCQLFLSPFLRKGGFLLSERWLSQNGMVALFAGTMHERILMSRDGRIVDRENHYDDRQTAGRSSFTLFSTRSYCLSFFSYNPRPIHRYCSPLSSILLIPQSLRITAMRARPVPRLSLSSR